MRDEDKRRRCVTCGLLTKNWQRVNGSPWHCYDGCYSTTGRDHRTADGKPAWLQGEATHVDLADVFGHGPSAPGWLEPK